MNLLPAPAKEMSVPIRRLFSPGPIAAQYNLDLLFSHRSNEFRKLYADTSTHLLKISGYTNVVMTQGSASSALETVLSSVLKSNSRLLMLVNGEFARRALQMATFCTDAIVQVADRQSLLQMLETDQFDFCFVVQFETSLSIHNDLKEIEEICLRKHVHLIVDAVSAFPYYAPPQAKFLLSTSSKQLGGLPAMGLVFYNDLDQIKLVERSDYLNLRKYITYSDSDQTPHTALIPQIDSLNNALQHLNVEQLRTNICRNALALTEGLDSAVVNERVAPVVTLRVRKPAELVNSLRGAGISLYYNQFYMNEYIQVGCFNYPDAAPYLELNECLRRSNFL